MTSTALEKAYNTHKLTRVQENMISSAPLPQAAALLFVIVANALVANTAPAAAFLHPPATAAPRPRGTWTSSSIHRANNEVVDRDLARSARRHETTASTATATATTTTTTTTTTSLRLFRNVFGRDGAVHDITKEDEFPAEEGGVVREDELARFAFPATARSPPTIPPPAGGDDLKFDSLSIMIGEWSKLFVADDEHGVKKVTGLTTPVTVVDLAADDEEREVEEEEDGDVVKFSGVQLLFKKGKTGGGSAYRDKDDERMHGKNEREDGRKKDDDDDADIAMEGGVQVRVERLSGGDLRVIASRCEVEEGTMTKEMSEGVIIDSLRKAVTAWRKEQAS